jgi:hypothetical protein
VAVHTKEKNSEIFVTQAKAVKSESQISVVNLRLNNSNHTINLFFYNQILLLIYFTKFEE